jgi:hypothetical protein
MRFENKEGYSFFFKKIETKYHICPFLLLHVFFLAHLLIVFRENSLVCLNNEEKY